MAVLEFPSRFALLARAWQFDHSSGGIAGSLGLSAGQLSKYHSGETKNLKQLSMSQVAQKLADHLDSKGKLKEFRTSRAAFIEAFTNPNDLEFIQFISQSAKPPLPSSVLQANRHTVDLLAGKIAGNCFLYRLGMQERRKQIKPNETTIRYVPVLRRIPVWIGATGANYLTYHDRYTLYDDNGEEHTADGFVFMTKDHINIFAEDVDAEKAAELFMMQLKSRPVKGTTDDERLYEGVLVMNGDQAVPTACKVVLRRAPEDLQQLEFAAFARLGETLIDLVGDQESKPLAVPEADDDERFNSTVLGSRKYSWYADRLQIRSISVDIALNEDG